MSKGYFNFVLHSHLPYVISHGQWPHGMDWLNEAACETYIPLLQTFDKVAGSGNGGKIGITIGITPILAEQIADDRFKTSFVEYLGQKIDAAAENSEEFSRVGDSHKAELAAMWKKFYTDTRNYFTDILGGDIIGRFRQLQNDGVIEIITCAATHGYLPLLSRDEAVQSQIKHGVAAHRRHFGSDPAGIWLPECAYRPAYDWISPLADEGYGPTKAVPRKGVEYFLEKSGIKYFLVDSHLLKGGKAIGVYIDRFESLRRLWQQFEGSYKPAEEIKERSPHLPYLVGDSSERNPVAFFTRDAETSLQVWSGEWGYPGDGKYLDFHKKHFPGGHRYWAVTSAKADLADKVEYRPEFIEEALRNQSAHFVGLVESMIDKNQSFTAGHGLVTAPFDTELFGHWWYEGPRWLEKVLELLAQSESVTPTSCGEYLSRYPAQTEINLPEGSWGEGGFHYIWLNDWNKWTWRHIYQAEDKMVEAAKKIYDGVPDQAARVACQMGRELLLLESSDWQFLISTWSARDYAEARVVKHSENFERLNAFFGNLCNGAETQDTDWKFLELCEENDNVFKDLDTSNWLL